MEEVSQQSGKMKGFGGMCRWVEVREGCGRQRLSLMDTVTSMMTRDLYHLLLYT